MLENAVRPKLDQLFFIPTAKGLQRLKFTPSRATALSLLLGILVCPLASLGYGLVGVVLLWLSGLFDVLDGSLARLTNQSSDKGAVFDILSDRAVEFAVILGLFFYDMELRALPCILMLGSTLLCVTSFLVVGMFSINESGKSFHYSPGLMERAEAFLFFSWMLLFPSAFLPLAYLFITLVLLTTAVRTYEFYKS